MARWILICPQCKQEFTHSQVNEAEGDGRTLLDPFSWIAGKPKFPVAGSCLTCPNCMAETMYQRHELIYKTD